MGDAVSLTKAQRELLEKIAGREVYWPRGAAIRTANRLDDLGLAKVASVRAGCGFALTPAGRSALADNQPGEREG